MCVSRSLVRGALQLEAAPLMNANLQLGPGAWWEDGGGVRSAWSPLHLQHCGGRYLCRIAEATTPKESTRQPPSTLRRLGYLTGLIRILQTPAGQLHQLGRQQGA
jgi:hypothetical protein